MRCYRDPKSWAKPRFVGTNPSRPPPTGRSKSPRKGEKNPRLPIKEVQRVERVGQTGAQPGHGVGQKAGVEVLSYPVLTTASAPFGTAQPAPDSSFHYTRSAAPQSLKVRLSPGPFTRSTLR
jgi:hypothetical protein